MLFIKYYTYTLAKNKLHLWALLLYSNQQTKMLKRLEKQKMNRRETVHSRPTILSSQPAQTSKKTQKTQLEDQFHQKRMNNFIIQSKQFLQKINLTITSPEKKNENKTDLKTLEGYTVNGIDYFERETIIDDYVEVLNDCVAVKGDYFYLKKGQKVKLSSVVNDYTKVEYHGFVGYFPCDCFKIHKNQEFRPMQKQKVKLVN